MGFLDAEVGVLSDKFQHTREGRANSWAATEGTVGSNDDRGNLKSQAAASFTSRYGMPTRT
jgi:hypothetical protein